MTKWLTQRATTVVTNCCLRLKSQLHIHGQRNRLVSRLQLWDLSLFLSIYLLCSVFFIVVWLLWLIVCVCDSDELLRQLFNSIKQPPDDVTDDVGDVPLDASFDYDWLHEIGSGFDDCPLPQHLSSNAQILQLCEHVMSLIRRLPKPAAVTIARFIISVLLSTS